MIKINELTKRFYVNKQEILALDKINLDIMKGEIFGIIGLSGAGKTTLLRTIAGLEIPDSGSVIIDNVDISKINKKNIRDFKKSMGIVFQGFNLLKQQTVFKNIAFPLEIDKISPDIINEKVHKLLELVGLSDKANVYPSKLSGGQIQRVAIARALASEPKVLLLDEITSALDPITTVQILKLLKQINNELNVTMLIITHDMKVVELVCDKVAIIYEGKIIESGKTNDIINNPQSDIGKILVKKEVRL